VPRRTSPDGTGYKIDLYRIEGLPDPASQVLEQKFMHLVDTQAVHALQRLVRQKQIVWDNKLRSAWVRFILSLVYRNPEVVSLVKEHMRAMCGATLEHARGNYEEARYLGDPPTFEEFLAQTDIAEPFKAAASLIQDVIDNSNVAPAILSMTWSSTVLGAAQFPLLTSDRPVVIPFGLAGPHAYIALPIGPKTLFIASRDGGFHRHVGTSDPTTIVREINRIVVEQAREFVWGTDDTQLRFVNNRIGRLPDRVILTDEQKRKAIEAIRSGGVPNLIAEQRKAA